MQPQTEKGRGQHRCRTRREGRAEGLVEEGGVPWTSFPENPPLGACSRNRRASRTLFPRVLSARLGMSGEQESSRVGR